MNRTRRRIELPGRNRIRIGCARDVGISQSIYGHSRSVVGEVTTKICGVSNRWVDHEFTIVIVGTHFERHLILPRWHKLRVHRFVCAVLQLVRYRPVELY